jgi:RNA polymerase sigma-70 factor (ECF subfamily)
MPLNADVLTRWFEQHRSFLWGLSYRMTGSAADADDVVQETFVRAWKHAPDGLDDPRGWLMRVAINAGRDVLRRRKRRGYVGPWLPMPIATGEDMSSPEPVAFGPTLERQYDLTESASLAFLQALEALTATQRAVLLLRDVFDYSAAEVAAALDLHDGNVRTIHHRARRAIESYERRRFQPTPGNRARADEALRRFLSLLSAGDVRGIERMLAADVNAVTDGGGEFTASLHPIAGAARVARFFARLAASRPGRIAASIRSINHLPTAWFVFESPRGRRPPRLMLGIDLDAAGLISNVRVIASATKLARIEALSGSWPAARSTARDAAAGPVAGRSPARRLA